MATIGMSDDLYIYAFVACIICKKVVPSMQATTGSTHADGRQAFACARHFCERPRWIIAWATFNAQQQRIRASLHTQTRSNC
jgi:hypothetical protein